MEVSAVWRTARGLFFFTIKYSAGSPAWVSSYKNFDIIPDTEYFWVVEVAPELNSKGIQGGYRQRLKRYFATLSLVNVVYGSLATAVVLLLTFEVAAVILLFGAQLIAEIERLGTDAAPGDFEI